MERASRSGVAVRQSYLLFISFLVILFIATSASFVFSQTDQYQSIKGVKFKDGTVIRGQVVQLNTDTVTIKTPDGNTFVRKFEEVAFFIRQDGDFAEPNLSSMPYGGTFISSDKRNYLMLKAGIYSPQSDDLDEFSTGFNGEIAFGHYINRNLAIEFGVGYFTTEASASGYVYGIRVIADATIKVVPLTLSLKAIYPIEDFEIYALSGVGMYLARGEAKLSVGGIPINLDEDDTAFGIHLGAGILYNVNKDVFLGFEGKYFWTKAQWEAYGTKLEPKLDGFLLTANVGFRF